MIFYLSRIRKRAPLKPSFKSGWADYAPFAGAGLGVILSLTVPTPNLVFNMVTILSLANSLGGFYLIGLAWPLKPFARRVVKPSLHLILLHFSVQSVTFYRMADWTSLAGRFALDGLQLPTFLFDSFLTFVWV